MLALALTFIVAAYLLGPELLSRWIQGMVVPRRTIIQSKSEELARAVLWSIGPLFLSCLWAWYCGRLRPCVNSYELRVFFSGIYSEKYFDLHTDEFFHAAHLVAWLNWCILWRLYVLLLALSISLNGIITRYGRIRNSRIFRNRPWLKSILATIVLPQVSEWHVLVSGMLLPNKDVQIIADVLTKSDVLYKGRLVDKTLSTDGSLATITLSQPSRFRREHYLDAKKTNTGAKAEDFWTEIPGNTFIVMASEIVSINLLHSSPVKIDYTILLDLLNKTSKPPVVPPKAP